MSPTRAHATVDRLGCASGQLLIDDRAHERSERSVGVARPVREGSCERDQMRDHRLRAATSSTAARSEIRIAT